MGSETPGSKKTGIRRPEVSRANPDRQDHQKGDAKVEM